MTKQCKCCLQFKSVDQFSKKKTSKDGLQSYCKPCAATKREEHRSNNLEMYRKYDRKYKYGVSPDEFDRMWKDQGGTCAICSKGLKLTSAGYAIDHNHTTGHVRGLLCMPCNTAIGLLQDDMSVVLAAASYLERTNDPERSPT